jgi:tryptophanyl-tRNA synthetase
MSESESDKGTIYLLDNIEVSKKKIMKAVTDSENAFYYNPVTKPGLSNLINIYSALSEKTVEEVVEQFKDTENYGVFKRSLCDLLEKELLPIQLKVAELKTAGVCDQVLKLGAMYADSLATAKMNLVYKNVGIN